MRSFLCAALLSLLPSPAAAQPLPEPALVELGMDRADRMTVPVSIGGQGPYRFVVDTGAERTVIARELAHSLGLGAGPRARVHSMSEVSDIATVLIPALEVGGKKVRSIHAPALSRYDLGAEGMLGVDSLKSQRVSFDFVRQEMRIVPSHRPEEDWARDSIVVTARSRFGHLVLVDASVDGQRVWVVVDTGSEVTVANSVLRRRLERKNRLGPTEQVEMLSVTGGRVTAERSRTREMQIGGIRIRDMPIAFSDVHPFRKLDLMDRPAILLGMDALRLFRHVSVDFANRRVRLSSEPQALGGPAVHVAAAIPAKRGG